MKVERYGMDEASLGRARVQLAETSRAIYQRGYGVARDGNVSVRIGEGHLLISPSGRRKGFLEPSDMILTTMDGAPIGSPSARVSKEIELHLAAYRARGDVSAVVHAHPPCAVAHSIAGISLEAPLVPEAFLELGAIITVPYATPTTPEAARAIEGPITRSHALILERHGTVTVGPTIEEAFDRLEILEHVAKMSLYSRVLSPGRSVDALSAEALAALSKLGA